MANYIGRTKPVGGGQTSAKAVLSAILLWPVPLALIVTVAMAPADWQYLFNLRQFSARQSTLGTRRKFL